MINFSHFFDRIFKPVLPLPPGIYHYQTPEQVTPPYRLHLRIQENGEGVLIFNASTILHLNPTATEYAYYFIQQLPLEQIIQKMNRRYRVPKDQVLKDYQELTQKLQAFTQTQDLDPIIDLNFDRQDPYSSISAPYRLDCAITYQVSGETVQTATPTDRVRRELTTSEWKTIINKAWQAGIPHILFTGGEPTRRPDLEELIRHAENLGQVTGLLTDGRRLGDSYYLKSLLQSGLDHMMILLEPGDDLVMEHIRQVIKEDIYLVVHLTITDQNKFQAVDTISQLSDAGIKAVSISTNDQRLNEYLPTLRHTIDSKGLRFVWDLPVPYSQFNPVALETQNAFQGAGKAWLYVEPDGDVLAEQGSSQVLGNLLNDPWESIWAKK